MNTAAQGSQVLEYGVRAFIRAVARRLRTSREFLVKRIFSNRVSLFAFCLLVAIIITSAVAPVLPLPDPDAIDLQNRLAPPSGAHWFGTDEFGRDLLSRVIWGGRISLLIGIVSVGIGLGTGIPLGMLAGYFRKLDGPISRLMEVVMAIPRVLLAIAIVGILGPGLRNVIIAVFVGTIPLFARLTRSIVLSVKREEYISAVVALGARSPRILFKHVLPNCIAPVIVFGSLQVGRAMLIAASLSFLGLGVQPPTAEWGGIISTGRQYLFQAPHISTITGFAIFLVVLCFNILGDSFRDALDPKLRQ